MRRDLPLPLLTKEGKSGHSNRLLKDWRPWIGSEFLEHNKDTSKIRL